MGYIKEARTEMQRYYGGYCNLCRRLETSPMPYCNFTIELYRETKKAYQDGKRQETRGRV